MGRYIAKNRSGDECSMVWPKLYSETSPTDGLKEGVTVGPEEVGPDDGATEGLDDGADVVLYDGAAVGPEDGVVVGLDDGAALGADEGAAVGLDEGAAVGKQAVDR